jgi:CubicO group peptidase (beta-lactamase class C family)
MSAATRDAAWGGHALQRAAPVSSTRGLDNPFMPRIHPVSRPPRTLAACADPRLAQLSVVWLLWPLTAPATQSPSRWQGAVAAYTAPYVQMNDFSGTILILRPVGDSLVSGFGFADRARGIRNGPDTRYGIGSLTKTFTAAAIAMLRERGQLAFEDTLGKFIPAFPHGGEITIEHLLAHTSGIPDYHSLPDYAAKRVRPITLAEFATWIGAKPLDSPPGAKDAYSSSGYAVLAYVIERVSGMSYSHFLRQNIFEPLRMTETGDLTEGGAIPRLAMGYDPGFPPDGVQPPPRMSATWLEGSGSLYSTVSDLAKWARAIMENRLFRMTALDYPYGWGKRTWGGRDVIEQDGRIALGYASHISIYPHDSLVLVILGNIQSAVADRMRADLAALVFRQPYTVPRLRDTARPAPELLRQYAGRYEVAPGFVLTVRTDGRRLTLAGPEGDYLPLEPETDTDFFFRALYVEVGFERDQGGHVADLKWDGQFTCKRLP